MGRINWFTNLEHKKRHEELILYKKYNPEEYPTYDNYDAIEVSKVKDIPADYKGAMGVPITFMDKFNPDQFEIIDLDRPLMKELTKLVGIRVAKKTIQRYRHKKQEKKENYIDIARTFDILVVEKKTNAFPYYGI